MTASIKEIVEKMFSLDQAAFAEFQRAEKAEERAEKLTEKLGYALDMLEMIAVSNQVFECQRVAVAAIRRLRE